MSIEWPHQPDVDESSAGLLPTADVLPHGAPAMENDGSAELEPRTNLYAPPLTDFDSDSILSASSADADLTESTPLVRVDGYARGRSRRKNTLAILRKRMPLLLGVVLLASTAALTFVWFRQPRQYRWPRDPSLRSDLEFEPPYRCEPEASTAIYFDAVEIEGPLDHLHLSVLGRGATGLVQLVVNNTAPAGAPIRVEVHAHTAENLAALVTHFVNQEGGRFSVELRTPKDGGCAVVGVRVVVPVEALDVARVSLRLNGAVGFEARMGLAFMEGLEVVSGDGDVVVEGVLAGEDGIALSTVRGRIRVKDVIANTMGLHSITGDIVGEGLGASSKLLVTSTSGVIKLDDIMTKYTSAFAESGSMAINRLTSSESIRISSVSAPITLHSLRGRFKSLVASSDTGNVRITSAQLRPDGAVEVSAHSRTGKCIVELVGFTGVFDVNTGSATAGVVVHGGAEAKWWVRDGRRRFGHYRFRYEGMHKLTAVSEAGPVRVILENGLRVKALT